IETDQETLDGYVIETPWASSKSSSTTLERCGSSTAPTSSPESSSTNETDSPHRPSPPTRAEVLRQQWPGLPESRGRAIRSRTSVVRWWVTCRKRLVLPLIDQLVLVFFVDRIGAGLLR